MNQQTVQGTHPAPDQPGPHASVALRWLRPFRLLTGVVSILYTSVYFLAERICQEIFLLPRLLDRLVRWTKLVQSMPFAILLMAAPVATYESAAGLSRALGEDTIVFCLHLLLWMMAVVIACVAHGVVTAPAASLQEIERNVQSRWPERWFARHIARPVDAQYLRIVIANSVLIGAGILGLLLPTTPTLFGLLQYVLGLFFISRSQEELDHGDIHNHFFRAARNTGAGAKLVVHATHWYLRLVLNPMCSRIPHFYRVHHVLMHHVENNSAKDLQTTMHLDRLSYVDFCRHALRLALSNSFGHDLVAYLVRRGRHKDARMLLLGLGAWFGIIALIGLHSPLGAAIILSIHFLSAVPGAINTYTWHGFIDPEDPENVHLNTVNAVAPANVASVGSLHIRHHLKCGEHWTKHMAMDEAEAQACLEKQVILLRPISGNEFIAAMWRDRLDIIASRVVSQPDTQIDAIVELLRKRSRPLSQPPHSALHLWVDRHVGSVMVKYVMAGVSR